MNKIKTEQLDKKFDAGEDIDQYVNWSSAKRVNSAALVKQARAKAHLSQKEFAEKFDLNLAN